MAQYWEDWSGSTIDQEPTGWTKRHVTTNVTYTVEEDVDGPAGRRLRITRSTAGRSGLSFDAVDSDGDRAHFKIRILAKVANTGANVSVGGTMARGSGAAASETLYNSQFRLSSTTAERALRQTKYVSGTFSEIATTVNIEGDLWEFEEPFWLGLEGNGTDLKYHLAAGATPETLIFTDDTSDSSISAAGWLGLYMIGVTTLDVLAVGIGTNGDEAPTSALSNNFEKSLSGSITPVGTLDAGGAKQNVGSITSTGSLSTKLDLHRTLAGSITGTGDLSTDHELEYVSGFDLENINPSSVSITNPNTATPDVSATPRAQVFDTGTGWIHFLMQLKNADGRTPEFTINTSQRWLNTTYDAAWRPTYTYDFETWHRASAFTALTSPARVRFTFDEAFNQGTVWVADHPVFRMSQSATLATNLLTHASGLVSPSAGADANGVIGTTPAEDDELDPARAVGEHPIYGFKIEDTSQTPVGGGPKRVMVLESGMHSAEAVDGWHLKGMVDWILEDQSALAQRFRQNWKVFLYFNLTPNGRYGGHWRGNFRSTKDPNRDWVGAGSNSLEETVIVKDAITADGLIAGRWDIFLGLHSASDRNNTPNIFRTQDSDTGLMDAFKAKFDAADPESLNIISSVLTVTSAYYAVSNGARLAGVVEPGTRINPGNERYIEVGENYMISIQQMDDDGLFIPETVGEITPTGSIGFGISKVLSGSITPTGSLDSDPPPPTDDGKGELLLLRGGVGALLGPNGFFRGRRFRLRGR